MTTTTTTVQKPGYISWGPLIWIALFHVGALLAFFPAFFSWSGVLVCLFLHWLTGGIGICMTYHRLLTHRSFVTRPKWLEYVLTIIGCCASEGGAIGWVADHRRHHAFSDQEGDVHSPDRGFGWAHMFWWMTPDVTSRHTDEYLRKWAPDLCKDPVHRFLNSYHIVFPLLMLAGLYALGGWSWVVWGGFVRTCLVLHTTWLVNSASHIWGYRTHETRDHSTNLWWVALLTYGEGWHNNHHAFQTSAKHGLAWWEIDMTYWAIRLMSFVGMAHTIKYPKLGKAAKAVEDDPIPAAAAQAAPAHRVDDEEAELVGASG